MMQVNLPFYFLFLISAITRILNEDHEVVVQGEYKIVLLDALYQLRLKMD